MANITTDGFRSISPELFISKGRVTINGNVLDASGTATISSTAGSYITAISGGEFTIWNYTEVDGTPLEITIDIDSLYLGTRTLTITQPQMVDVEVFSTFGMAGKSTAISLFKQEELYANDFVYQDECCYNEKVFASNDNLWWKNDKSSFLLKKILTSDSIIFKLYKDDVEIEVLNTDAFGEYYSFEGYTGFVLYWELVYLTHGAGSYQVKADVLTIGVASEWLSQEFCLSLYSDEAADKTFRIESYQQGTILRSGYNYDELGLSEGWYQSFRITGQFGNKKPSLENDYLMTSDRKMLQIQDKVSYEYVLQTGLIPASVGKILIEDNIIANRILLTDYNLYNTEFFRRVEVYPSAINDVKSYPYQRNLIYEVAFKDRFDDILKRN